MPLRTSPKVQTLLSGVYKTVKIVQQDTDNPALMDLRTNTGMAPLYEGANVIDIDGTEYTLVVGFDAKAVAVTIDLEGEYV